MKINIAQLLKEPVGAVRIIDADEQIAGKNGEHFKISGEITLTHTDKGVLTTGVLEVKSTGICSRCLETFNYSGKLVLEEEFLPVIDIHTGLRVSHKDDNFIIDEHHNIDLHDVLYQYACMSVPMKLLCKDDCAGICPTCGTNLNKVKCQCNNRVDDKRWAKLSALRKEGK